jgi:hypothetical protein
VSDVSFRTIFARLTVDCCLLLLRCLLCERRILLVSADKAVLHQVAQAAIELMYPFQWQHTFAPVLPYIMADVLSAPVPYFIGIPYELAPESPPADSILFDLDAGSVSIAGDFAHPPPLPPTVERKIVARLVSAGARHVFGLWSPLSEVTWGPVVPPMPQLHPALQVLALFQSVLLSNSPSCTRSVNFSFTRSHFHLLMPQGLRNVLSRIKAPPVLSPLTFPVVEDVLFSKLFQTHKAMVTELTRLKEYVVANSMMCTTHLLHQRGTSIALVVHGNAPTRKYVCGTVQPPSCS